MEGIAVDYVVPMVFHNDPLWQETFLRAGRRYNETNLNDFVRYRSWGTEELLVRCVRKFMPFVRTIYIILAQKSQRKEWMDNYGIRVVYHNEFIPESVLPTFNSRAMEMFLKDIPGISDYFLYGNDDMYPVAPLTIEDFFQDCKPRIQMTKKVFPEEPNNFQEACMCGLNFVAKEFGKHFTDSWYKNGHSIAPILKSTCEHIWERGGDEIMASITPFRERNNFNQYIYSWWQFLSGNYVEGRPARKYVSTKDSVFAVVKAIRECKGIICVNDNPCVRDYKKYALAVRNAIADKLNKESL